MQRSLSGPDSPSALSGRLGKIVFKALLGRIEHLPRLHVEGWWMPASARNNSIIHNHIIAQLHTGPEWPYSAKQLGGSSFLAPDMPRWALPSGLPASRLKVRTMPRRRTSNHSKVLESLAGGICILTIPHNTEYICIQLLNSYFTVVLPWTSVPHSLLVVSSRCANLSGWYLQVRRLLLPPCHTIHASPVFIAFGDAQTLQWWQW